MIAEPIERVVTPDTLRESLNYAFSFAKQVFEDGADTRLYGSCYSLPVKSTRSLQANACMWAHLTDISRQVVWHGNKLAPSEWKDVISAGLKAQKVVPNIYGTGFVVLGQEPARCQSRKCPT